MSQPCLITFCTIQDTIHNIPREAEGFFPPPEKLRPPPAEPSNGSKKESATPSSSKKSNSYAPPPPPLSVADTGSSGSPAGASKKKKKSSYVPPAPITATVPVETVNPRPPSPELFEQLVAPKPHLEDKTSTHTDPHDLSFSEGSLDTSEALLSPPDNPDLLGSVADLLGDASVFDIIGKPDDLELSYSNDQDFFLQHSMMDKPATSSSTNVHDTPQPSSLSGMRFDELYRLKGVLGTGAFSTVREGFHRSNADFSYAVKCINRKKLSEEDEAALLDEVGILKAMRHVNIIRLYDFFEEPSTYYLVMERMRGGELFDRIVAKAYYNEKEARDTCKILLEAVGHCHDNHVAHRDLKPENLLLLSEHDDTSVKIADFGFAKKVYERNSLSTQCGTPGYVAPEILEGTPYDERADMWSVGVILYILLGGYPPFIESTQRDLFRKIRRGEYEFHEEYWGTVSSEAKQLISSLLTVDVNDRLTADEALENPWIMGDDAKLAKKDLGPNLQKFRNFNAKRKFRAAVSTIIAINKLNSLKEDFFTTLKETAVQQVDQLERSSHTPLHS